MWDLGYLRPTGAGRFGLRANAPQMATASSLVLLVGGSLQLAKLAVLDAGGREFGQVSYFSKVSFLVPFAVMKALANLVVGFVSDRVGRKWMEALGWAVGMVVPLLVMAAPPTEGGWSMVVGANLFLGAQQGLAWSATMLIFMDLLGPERRGLAAGLNESLGYTAIASFARVYGAIEERSVHCGWKDSPAGRTAECLAAQTECSTPDDWHAACVGSCICEGYTREVFGVVFLLMAVGGAVSVFLLKDTIESHVAVEAERSSEAAGGLRGRGDDEESEQPLRALTAESAVSLAGGSGTGGWDDADSGDEDSGARGGLGTGSMGDGVSSQYKAPEWGSGGEYSARDRVAGRGDGVAPVGEGFWPRFVWTSLRNPSTAVMCWAGFVTNFMTGLAWGLVLAWARDGLGESGLERNFVASCYSFLKGMTQLGAGLLSDRAGRKWLVAAGMFTCASGLACAALGAGFGGYFLGDVGSEEQLRVMQFGYLVLAGTLMGVGTGLMYPVLTAAVADHAEPGARGAAVGTYRFWRDLGYAGGAPVAALADAGGPEGGLLAVAGVAALTGVAVIRVYRDPGGAVAGRGGAGGKR